MSQLPTCLNSPREVEGIDDHASSPPRVRIPSAGIEEGRAEGRAQGEAAGQARAILQVPDRREIAVDDASRERIVSCADLDTLTAWLDRSLTATQVSDLFA
jgi:hypothetical protein